MRKHAKKAPVKREPPKEAEAPPPRAILVELENVAVSGRHILYCVVEQILAHKDVKLSTALFSKHCLDVPLQTMVPTILKATQKTRLSAEKMLSEIENELRATLTGSKIKCENGFRKLVNAASGDGIIIGGWSMLDRETVLVLAATLGMPELSNNIFFASETEVNTAGRNPWLDAARALSITPSACLAIPTSTHSCTAALDARMRCVAIPDRYTAFQAFSGADYVFDKLDDSAVDTILNMLQNIES